MLVVPYRFMFGGLRCLSRDELTAGQDLMRSKVRGQVSGRDRLTDPFIMLQAAIFPLQLHGQTQTR